jgi:hypothetical protein
MRHDQVAEVRVMGMWAPLPVGTMVAGHRADIAPGRHCGLERRMTIEEPWHDTKRYRFGIGSEWPQSRTAAYLARWTLLSGGRADTVDHGRAGHVESRPGVGLLCQRQRPRLPVMRVRMQFFPSSRCWSTRGYASPTPI